MVSRLTRPQFQKIAASLVFAVFAIALVAEFIFFPSGSTLPPILRVAGKFHPLLLHFPIGVVMAAAVLEVFTGVQRRHDSAVNWLLWLGFISSTAAVLAGYLLGAGKTGGETLTLHMWTGISVPVLIFLSLLAKLHYDQHQPLMSKSLYRVPLLTTVLAVFAAGHFGGTLTHGDILKDVRGLMVTRPILSSLTTSPENLPENRTVYNAVIAPLLARTCTDCHGEDKSKGDLRLHTPEAMLLAGESKNPAIVPGSSATSEAMLRLLLPSDDEDHMPPEEETQLTADELQVLRWWIDNGAKTDLKLSDPGIPSDLQARLIRLAAATLPGEGAHGEEGPRGGAGAAGEEAAASDVPDMAPVQALEKELGVAILPLAQNDPALTFNCVNVADKFGDAELAKFAPLADRMSEMNLGRSKVTDAGLSTVAGMKNLKKLHLPNTAVTDAGIESLLGLENLEYLNLFNTKVTDAGIAKLEKLAKLKRLYVWQTGVTKPAAEALHTKLPGIVINLGWDNEVKTVMAAASTPEALPAPAAPAEADPEQPVYVALIQPIFNARCTGCHGEDKKKGKLQMHTFEALMKNGDSEEATVVPGKSAESLIIKRAALAAEDDDHMPPSDKEQLSEKQLGILKWWIDAGAKTDVKLKDAALPDNLK